MTTRHELLSGDYRLFEALSGDFSPKIDPDREHRLSRVALAVAEKGRIYVDPDTGFEYPEGLVYTPSWARGSVAELWVPNDREQFNQQVVLQESYGRHPRRISFTHEPTRMPGIPRKNYLVVRDTRGNDEAAYDLSDDASLAKVRYEVANRALDFYDFLKPNL
ncbi:hypothetical protein KBD87_02305 [Candidatus Saccharibacteria bacterium]|nr:hypothetical protein [Candidatus Saccharibacteria bacterium]